jgi:DNA-binding MurR/RpiR family transcriptional regulator
MALAMPVPDIDDRLRHLMPSARGPLAAAIRFILAHREEVPVRSMRELAKRAGVAPVTLVRLAQKLGFEGFDEFREVYVQAFINGQSRNRGQAAQLMSLAQAEGALGFAAKFADGEDKVHRETIAQLRDRQLDAAAQALVDADQVFVIGRRNFFAAAYGFAYALRKAKPRTSLLDSGGGMSLELDDLGARDVLVGFTAHPYSRITLGAAQVARSQGATVIAVTDSENAPIAQLAAHVFVTLNRSYAFPDSISGAQLVGNILIGLTVSKLGSPVLERIQRNEAQIGNTGEYVVSSAPRARRISWPAATKGRRRK